MRIDLDLNLLKTLIVLTEKQNLNKAGVVLGLTESAVSKQLNRLREQLNDDLFVRMSGKFEPTDYTVSILPKIKMALTDIEETVVPSIFEPSKYVEPIHIALPDLVMEKFGIGFYERLLMAFPNAPITIHSWGDDTETKIIAGDVNLGIHLFNPDRSMSIYQQKLSDDKLVIAVAKQHGHCTWDDVKDWPFIKQRAIGWNEQKFQFIYHLHNKGIDLNYSHDIDTASFALKLMQRQKVANVLPHLLLSEDLIQVEGSEFVSYDTIWATNTRLTDRKSPLYQYLHRLFFELIS
ncbi:LysR family transcriptional regulator [Vibrio sp. Scap24]|uniref:LysR family transcriptional regulator n=1 Tax=unclassified Vibrio TaxID=2614977 RepID=UPI00159E972A|nr:LysR family transcriptional regulator [Vibrio sp. Scap24]NVN83604.1 LysR family transcriptional regulator [Vibrio sp. Scap16]QLE94252.1 LysR family transcriptional regulator [Vibrio sp. Scap24]